MVNAHLPPDPNKYIFLIKHLYICQDGYNKFLTKKFKLFLKVTILPNDQNL